MKRFTYHLHAIETGRTCVEEKHLADFAQLCAGTHVGGCVIESDTRLDPTFITVFQRQAKVSVELLDAVAVKARFWLAIADTYPRATIPELEQITGESCPA